MDNEWTRKALGKYRLGSHPWRAHIFAPIEHVRAINQGLREAWNDSGDNLSVPMSSTGKQPATFKAASGVLTDETLTSLLDILRHYSGSGAYIVPSISASGPEEVLAVYGLKGRELIGQKATFWDCADILDLKRVDYDVFPDDTNGSELLLQTIVTLGPRTDDGELVETIALPWLAIRRELNKDPGFLQRFAQYPRKFEEFLAASYARAGYEVELTPRSRDKGRDVIATKHGFGSVRILDQAKAYSAGKLVTHDDVRAMLGVLSTESNASKGIVTTTSDFQPGILAGTEFSRFIPYRLELKNGEQLKAWLNQLK